MVRMSLCMAPWIDTDNPFEWWWCKNIRTGTICFDTDFPFLTRSLSSGDLLLESSATWSNIGFSAIWNSRKVTPKRVVNTKPLSFKKQQNHVFSWHVFIVGFPPETGGTSMDYSGSGDRELGPFQSWYLKITGENITRLTKGILKRIFSHLKSWMVGRLYTFFFFLRGSGSAYLFLWLLLLVSGRVFLI